MCSNYFQPSFDRINIKFKVSADLTDGWNPCVCHTCNSYMKFMYFYYIEMALLWLLCMPCYIYRLQLVL